MRLPQIRRLTATLLGVVVLAGCSSAATPLPSSSPSAATPLPSSSASPAPTTLTPTPTPTSGPAASATPVVTPLATDDPTPEPTHGSWALETTLPEFRVGDLVGARGLVIAVGCKPASEFGDCVRAKIVVSTAGDWAPAQLEDAKGEIFLWAVAADADGFAAVGVERGPGLDSFGELASTAASFISADGLTWRRAPDQTSLHGRVMSDVVARPGGGWIAVGHKSVALNYEGFETWSSADGLAWKLVGSIPAVTVRGVAPYNGGLLAWGDECGHTCGPVPVIIWTSTNGRDWDRAPDQPSRASADFGGIVGLSNGTLAVGSRWLADGSGVVGTTWLSTDATTWPRKTLPDGKDFGSFELATGAGGFVAVGALASGEDVVWNTWISEDGATWKRLPDAELAAGVLPGFPRPALAADGASVVFAGQSASSGTGSAVFRLRIE